MDRHSKRGVLRRHFEDGLLGWKFDSRFFHQLDRRLILTKPNRRPHHHVDVGLIEPLPRLCRSIEQRLAGIDGARLGSLRRHRAIEAPDLDHGVDAALQVAQHADHLAGALAGQILERARGVNLGRLGVEQVADCRVHALFAQGPSHLLDPFRARENVRGGGLRRLHHRVELLARLAELPGALGVRLHRGDLGFGPRDRLRHVQEVEADAVYRGDGVLAAHHGLDAIERLEQHRGVGVAVAPRVFGQEPAPARRLHDGRLDRLVVGLADRRRYGKIGHRPSDCGKTDTTNTARIVTISLMAGSNPTIVNDSFAWRLALVYAAFFLIVGWHLPLFPVWLTARGLDPAAIGFVLAAMQAVRIIATPAGTRIADRYGSLHGAIVMTAVATAVAIIVLASATGFTFILVAAVTVAFISAPVMPLTDAYGLKGLA